MSFTRQQQAAIGKPALLAEECAHPRYGALSALGSVVVTINTGYE